MQSTATYRQFLLIRLSAKAITFCLLLTLLTAQATAQNIDSLEQYITRAKSTEDKAETLIRLATHYQNLNPSLSESYATRAIELSGTAYSLGRGKGYLVLGQLSKNKLQYDQALAYYSQALNVFRQVNELNQACRASYHFGQAYFELGEYVKALEYAQTAKDLLQENTTLNLRAQVLTLLCNVHYNLGGSDKSIPECLEALRMFDEAGDQRGQSGVLSTLGDIYLDLSQYNKARRYFFEALDLARQTQNWPAIANSLSTIGNMYLRQNEYDDALIYFNDALEIQLQIGNLRKLSELYLNKGQALLGLKQIPESRAELEKALSYALDGQDLSLQARALLGLGEVLAAEGEPEQAVETTREALNVAQRVNARPIMLECYRNMAKFYDKMGNIEEAFIYFNLYMRQNEAIYTRETAKRIAEAEALYELEQKEKQIGLLEKENEIQHLEARQERILNYSLIVGILLILILAIALYYGYRVKVRSNRVLQEQKEAINRQKEEIETQRDDIQIKNQQITEFNTQLTDSIRYARHIQSSLLPENTSMKQAFPSSFVFYKPKDIVSGDFYWFVQLEKLKLVAAVDCTGHGVPGAFMTVLANTLLNQIVLETGITEPSMIITLLDQKVQSNLHQKDMMDNLVFDGMDISLCAINEEEQEISFCGAKLPLYYATPEGVQEIKGDRYPVGSSQYDEKLFTSHSIKYQKGDLIYLSSDGFQDQFGGPKGKKFMKARFRRMIEDIHGQPITEQLNRVNQIFYQWKQGQELTDDIMLLGIKL